MKVSHLLLAVLFVSFVSPQSSADAPVVLTSTWQIATYDANGNNTTAFQSDSLVNISVLPPQIINVGGNRILVLWSVTTGKELARYTLGYYASGAQNASTPPQIVQINFAAFSGLMNGATLLLQIRSPSDTVEFTSAIAVTVNIQALIDALKRQIFAGDQALNDDIVYLKYMLQVAQESNNKYFMMLGIVFLFMIAYVTRDKWLHRKKLDETKKSESEFEYFLEQFVRERYTPGDAKEAVDGEG